MFSPSHNSHRIFKRLAKALISLRVCAGWSEPLLVAHTTLLEISCHGSIIILRCFLGSYIHVLERCLINVGHMGKQFLGPNTLRRHNIGPRCEKTCRRWFANNKGADQPAHSHSLISVFVIRYLESTISKQATSEISIF